MKRYFLPLLPASVILTAALPFAQVPDGGEALIAAQEPLLKTFVKVITGPEATVDNASGTRLGIVRDHVIDPSSGKVLFVIVGAGKQTELRDRLVPYNRFVWNADERRLVLPMSEAELESMRPYPPKKKERPEPTTGDVRGSRILARGSEFASVDELVLEPKRGTIAFVLASAKSVEGDPYVIPWQALKWTAGSARGHFAIDRIREELTNAPKLVKSDLRRLSKRGTVARIFAFYGLTPPLEGLK